MTLLRLSLVLVVSACGAVGANDAGVIGADGGTDASALDGGVRDAGFPPLTATERALLDARPYRLVVPSGYDGGVDAVALVVLLHGYQATGALEDTYFAASALAEKQGFLLATPDGVVDATNKHYWNVFNVDGGPDDVAYLTAIVTEVQHTYRVDPKQTYFVGHSNGGFMSHRMACERASRVAGIVSLAGTVANPSNCAPSERVPVLQVHGTADDVVAYDGGSIASIEYPSAQTTVLSWATLNGCAAHTSSGGANLDLDAFLVGSETVRVKYDGCPSGGDVELWTIQGGGHIPWFTSEWGDDWYAWLKQHRRFE